MDKPVDAFWGKRMEACKEALTANNFEVHAVPDLAGARAVVMEKILPAAASGSEPLGVSWGGSMTFEATGLMEAVKGLGNVTVLDTYERPQSSEDKMERRRRALLSDVFFTGANAVTEDGKLVNLDMIGNRVAALAFGPRHVIVLAGRNKIVADLDEAMFRIKNYAAPANAMRLDKKTPCVKTSYCQECKSEDRICNVWAINEKSFPKGRIKVVLINQDLGL